MNALSDDLYKFTYLFPAGLAIFSAVIVSCLIMLVLCFEMPARKRNISFHNVFTPTNTALFGNQICTVIYLSLESMLYYSKRQWNPCEAFAYFFLGSTLAYYGWFAWLRAANVVKRHASVFVRKRIQSIMYVTAGACLLPGIIKLIPFEDTVGTSLFVSAMTLSGLLVLGLDMYFVRLFIHQILKMEADIAVNQQLNTIAKYGLISTCACFICIVSFIVHFMLERYNDEEQQGGLQSAAITFLGLKNAFLMITSFTLFQMKVTLVQGLSEDSSFTSLQPTNQLDSIQRKTSAIPPFLMNRRASSAMILPTEATGNTTANGGSDASGAGNSTIGAEHGFRRPVLVALSGGGGSTRTSKINYNSQANSLTSTAKRLETNSTHTSQSQLASTGNHSGSIVNLHYSSSHNLNSQVPQAQNNRPAAQIPRVIIRRNTLNFEQGFAAAAAANSSTSTKRTKTLGSSTLSAKPSTASLNSSDSTQST